jgi:hypothetical protein
MKLFLTLFYYIKQELFLFSHKTCNFKRKQINKTFEMSQSQSTCAASNSSLRSNKRKARGDQVPSFYMRNGVELEDTGLKYLIAFKSGQYDVVGERDIYIDDCDKESGIVYDKSKPYEIQIIAKGEFVFLCCLLIFLHR